MDEEEKKTEAYPSTSSKIDHLLREMEATVANKKDKRMERLVSQIRKLAQLQNSTTTTLEGTHEKLKSLETELGEIQILREGILALRKEAEQEDHETEQFEAAMEEKIRALEGAMKRPAEIAVKLEREIKQTIPQKFLRLEEAVNTTKGGIEELKKAGKVEESHVLEQRLALLEEELRITSERMDTLEQLLEGVKLRISSFMELKGKMEEMVSRRSTLMEKLELEEEKLDSMELSLTKVKGRLSELSEQIMTLEEELGKAKATGGIDTSEVIKLRKEVLLLKKLIGKTRAEKVGRKELEEFETKIGSFMERHAQIIEKITE